MDMVFAKCCKNKSVTFIASEAEAVCGEIGLVDGWLTSDYLAMISFIKRYIGNYSVLHIEALHLQCESKKIPP